jgi:hypothetical protein
MRFVTAALCCFSFFLGTIGHPAFAATPLESLLAKAHDSSGAPYQYHVISRSHETVNGRIYQITTETEGLKYRARRCSKSICSGFYFDGDHDYDYNFNDTALPIANVIDGLQLTLRAIASYAFTSPDFRAKGGTITDRGIVGRAGKSYRQIAIAPRSGALLDAIVDPDTGIVVGVVSDAQRLAFEFRDQRKVGDKLMLPYTVALNGAVIERFDDRRVSPDPLEAPIGLVPKFSGTEPIAFKKMDRSTPQAIVPCTIAGQEVSCLLDTGTSTMSMSLELCEKLGIEPQTDAFNVSGVGKYVTGIAKAPALSVGGATYPAANYVVLHDLHQNGYDVVLGTDAFAHAQVTIDYGARTATFAPTPASGDMGDLTFTNFIPVAPIKLGDTPLRLAVDTGDESAINLSYSVYTQHPSIFKATGSAPVSGIGGSSEEVTGDLRSARLGNFELTNLKIGATKHLAATSEGHIGSGLLQHFSVTFDYAHARMDLVPRAGDASVKAIS